MYTPTYVQYCAFSNFPPLYPHSKSLPLKYQALYACVHFNFTLPSLLQACAHRFRNTQRATPLGRCYYTTNRQLEDFETVNPCPVGGDNNDLDSGGVCQAGTSSVIIVSGGVSVTFALWFQAFSVLGVCL